METTNGDKDNGHNGRWATHSAHRCKIAVYIVTTRKSYAIVVYSAASVQVVNVDSQTRLSVMTMITCVWYV